MNKIIINYGIVINDDQFAALPIHLIDGVLCNYTFVKRLDDGVKYNSELGQMKKDSMQALGLEFHIIDIPNSSKEAMQAEIARFIDHSQLNQIKLRLFYTDSRRLAQMTPFTTVL